MCNECFSKITELYYFNIQIRKAEKVLNRLAKRFEKNKDEPETCKLNIEVDDYQEIESISDVTNISAEENETYHDEVSEQDLNETSEAFEEVFDIEAVLECNEISSHYDEATLLKEQKSPLLMEIENSTDLRPGSSDEEINSENNLIEYLESCDTDNGGTLSTSTVEKSGKVKYILRKTKVKPNKKRIASASARYRHKQPRVTSPLLDDFDCAICHIVNKNCCKITLRITRSLSKCFFSPCSLLVDNMILFSMYETHTLTRKLTSAVFVATYFLMYSHYRAI